MAIAIFLIKKEYFIISGVYIKCFLVPKEISYFIYLIICILLAGLSLCLATKLSDDKIEKGTIKSLEQASDAFLPSYLGYFFVSVSIESVFVFVAVFLVITILIFFSRAAYFNPLYFLFGYCFYYATSSQGAKVLIITKRKLKIPREVAFENIKRINDFTFIDISKEG